MKKREKTPAAQAKKSFLSGLKIRGKILTTVIIALVLMLLASALGVVQLCLVTAVRNQFIFCNSQICSDFCNWLQSSLLCNFDVCKHCFLLLFSNSYVYLPIV